MTHASPPPVSATQLLVSVRNLDEARKALSGGCDVLDIKAPERGSLGMADAQDIAAIVSGTLIERSVTGRQVPVSAALGEALDWSHRDPPHRDIPQLPAGITFLKLGTGGLAAHADWATLWQRTRERFDESTLSASGEEMAAAPRWIVVAYADWQRVQAPAPREVLAAARELNCSGVLIDTCVKDGLGLLHWMTDDALREFVAQAAGLGLLSALAGSLSPGDALRIRQIAPDLVGIRSAACRAGKRQGEIDTNAVRRFKSQLVHANSISGKPAAPVATRGESSAASGVH